MARVTALELQTLLDSSTAILESLEACDTSYRDSLNTLTSFAADIRSQTDTSYFPSSTHRSAIFHHLARCLEETRVRRSDQHAEILCVLANASREAKWRREFGDHTPRSPHPGWPAPLPNLSTPGGIGGSSFEGPLCVLEVALRTLDEQHAGREGLAAYHSLRLVSNCCADNDANKRVVLECGGIELLLRCARAELFPDAATVALWNICADCDDLALSEHSKPPSTEPAGSEKDESIIPSMCSIATVQLSLRPAKECEAASLGNHSDPPISENPSFVSTLLRLACLVTGEDLKEMATEILEKALWNFSFSASTSAEDDGHAKIPPETSLAQREIRPSDFLEELLQGSGRDLALSVRGCNRDIVQSIALLASQARVQQEIINEDLVGALFKVLSWIPEENTPAVADSTGTKLRQSLVKIIYSLTASSGFISKYADDMKSSSLSDQCIASILEIPRTAGFSPTTNQIPPAPACIVLANLIRCKEDALFLVQERGIHPSIKALLSAPDPIVLFPAIALLNRLAMPQANKSALFDVGVVPGLSKIFQNWDLHPSIQGEAVSALRTILEGSFDLNCQVGPECGLEQEASEARQEARPSSGDYSPVIAALELFDRTSDMETKLQVARFIIAICRTIFHAKGAHSEEADKSLRIIFGKDAVPAKPVAFLLRHAPMKSLQGEGWYVLAILSTWDGGRPAVLQCLEDHAIQEKVDAALKQQEQGFCENISLMLAELCQLPSHEVEASTFDFVRRSAITAGVLPAN